LGMPVPCHEELYAALKKDMDTAAAKRS